MYVCIYSHICILSFSVLGKNCCGACQVEKHKYLKVTHYQWKEQSSHVCFFSPWCCPPSLYWWPAVSWICYKLAVLRIGTERGAGQNMFWCKIWSWVQFQWNWATIIASQCHKDSESLLSSHSWEHCPAGLGLLRFNSVYCVVQKLTSCVAVVGANGLI